MGVFAYICRILGSDAVYAGGSFGRRFYENIEQLNEIIGALSKIDDIDTLHKSIPIVSGGINPTNIHTIFKSFGTQIVLVVGSSIYRHPKGIKNGLKAFHEAIDCFMKGRVWQNEIEKGRVECLKDWYKNNKLS